MAYNLIDEIIKISAKSDELREAADNMRQSRGDTKSGGALSGVAKVFSEIGGQIKGFARRLNNFVGKLKSVFTHIMRGLGIMSFVQVVGKAAKTARDIISKSSKLSDNIDYSALKAGKTVEKYRSEQIALQAMGKTIDEINKDSALKKQYDELVNLGQTLSFSRASVVSTSLSNIGNSITRLKFVFRMGMSQVYEYFKAYAARPLEQLKSWFRDVLRKWQVELNGVPKLLGKGLANLARSLITIGQSIYKSFDFIRGAFEDVAQAFSASSNEIKIGLGLIAGVFAAWVLPFKPIALVFLMIWLLIDDYITWQNGGASFFGDAWMQISKAFKSVGDWIKSHLLLSFGIWIASKIAWHFVKKAAKWAIKKLWKGLTSIIGKIASAVGVSSFELISVVGMAVMAGIGVYRFIDEWLPYLKAISGGYGNLIHDIMPWNYWTGNTTNEKRKENQEYAESLRQKISDLTPEYFDYNGNTYTIYLVDPDDKIGGWYMEDGTRVYRYYNEQTARYSIDIGATFNITNSASQEVADAIQSNIQENVKAAAELAQVEAQNNSENNGAVSEAAKYLWGQEQSRLDGSPLYKAWSRYRH